MDTPKPPRKRAINVRLPRDLIDRIDRAARGTGRTRTAILEAGAHHELKLLETVIDREYHSPADQS